MSNYTTDELVDVIALWKTHCEIDDEGNGPCTRMCIRYSESGARCSAQYNAIIAKLRAGDALYEDVKWLEKNVEDSSAFWARLHKTRADYERKS